MEIEGAAGDMGQRVFGRDDISALIIFVNRRAANWICNGGAATCLVAVEGTVIAISECGAGTFPIDRRRNAPLIIVFIADRATSAFDAGDIVVEFRIIVRITEI